jgi:predicted RNA methylase
MSHYLQAFVYLVLIRCISCQSRFPITIHRALRIATLAELVPAAVTGAIAFLVPVLLIPLPQVTPGMPMIQLTLTLDVTMVRA